MTPALEKEIGEVIANPGYDGYRIALQMHFLGDNCGIVMPASGSFRCFGGGRRVTSAA